MSIADDWMKANGHKWPKRKTRPTGNPSPAAIAKRKARKAGHRLRRGAKGFVESKRNVEFDGCIFVPGAQDGVVVNVSYLGQNISAARYMALLTFGAPKSEGMVVRHLCGNGHLSCVNPKHLAWGTAADNISDMVLHRKAGDDVQDRISAVIDR